MFLNWPGLICVDVPDIHYSKIFYGNMTTNFTFWQTYCYIFKKKDIQKLVIII